MDPQKYSDVLVFSVDRNTLTGNLPEKSKRLLQTNQDIFQTAC